MRPAAPASASVTPEPQVAAMLRSSRVAWLSTVDEDGAPALVPTWFWWDGEVFWLFAKPGQRKLRNIRRFERVTLAVGDPQADFDVQLVEGSAHAVPAATSTVMPAGMKRAYDSWLAGAGLDWDRYCTVYRQPIIVRPTRFLPWRGLSHRPPRVSRPAEGSAARPMVLRPSATLA
jgi:PPOX class probable F420-dependent enzyme